MALARLGVKTRMEGGNERARVMDRLKELAQMHAAALGEGPGEPYGCIQDEQLTRKSYRLVAREALQEGLISPGDLAAAGLPAQLEQSPDTPGSDPAPPGQQ